MIASSFPGSFLDLFLENVEKTSSDLICVDVYEHQLFLTVFTKDCS